MAARARSAPLGRSKWPLEFARPGTKTPHLPTFATSSPLGSAGALEMAAQARSAPLGRSRWPLEPARLRWGARNGRSNSLGSARALEIARPGWSKTLQLPTFPSSSTLGSSGALDMAARARSAPLGRSKWPLELARTRSASPRRWKLLGLAARKHCTCRRFRVRARSAPLGRSTLALEPARLRWTGDASLGRTTDACCAQHRDEHTPCMVCTGPH